MVIKSNKIYTNNRSDLKVYIHRVFHSSDTYYKVKLTLINKKNGITYDTAKGYKLYKKNIEDWYEIL